MGGGGGWESVTLRKEVAMRKYRWQKTVLEGSIVVGNFGEVNDLNNDAVRTVQSQKSAKWIIAERKM